MLGAGCGLRVLDVYVAPVLCVFGNLTMRRAPFHVVQTQPSKTYIDFRATVEEVAVASMARRHNIFVEWSLGHSDAEKVFHDINKRLQHHDCFLCVGILADPDTDERNVLAYIRKQGTRSLPDLTLDGCAPSVYCPLTDTRRQNAAVNAISTFAAVICTAAGNIVVQKPSQEQDVSFHQVLHACQSLSKLDLAMIKGQIRAKTKKEQSEFDLMFMRVLPVIMEIRQINDASAGSMLFNSYAPPFKVCPLDKLINLGQLGRRLKEVAMTEETFTLKDAFRKASILENFSVILLGSTTTTGYGKTQYTLRLAIEWTKAYCEFYQLPKDSAMIYISSTIDPAKNVQFRPGMAWILDEFHPYDSQQNVHMSETMLKVLLTPQMSGTIRGRCEDVRLVAGVARLISANSNSPQAWCGDASVWSEPLRRKSIHFNITEPLCSDEWRVQASSESAAVNAGFDHVLLRNTEALQ